MKRILIGLLLLTAAGAAWSCSDDDGPGYTLRVLTFEDSDYRGSSAVTKYWTSLVDTPQYQGPLLYGNEAGYTWCDENNTGLCSGMIEADFWSGGHAISNYRLADIGESDYTKQLAVPTGSEGAAGHNGSKNFCIHNGYVDASSFIQTLPALRFRDGRARVVDHLYGTNTSYVLRALKLGDGYNPAAGAESWFKIIATGYDAAGAETGTAEFYLYRNGAAVEKWTRFDLWTLGEVARIEFNIQGSADLYGGYGLNTPAYFAYDDVAVRF